jgi:hypothetical protein
VGADGREGEILQLVDHNIATRLLLAGTNYTSMFTLLCILCVGTFFKFASISGITCMEYYASLPFVICMYTHVKELTPVFQFLVIVFATIYINETIFETVSKDTKLIFKFIM